MTSKRRHITSAKAYLQEDTIPRLADAIKAAAKALDVPATELPAMLDTAFDVIERNFEGHAALVYTLILNVFALYHFSDDSYDELMSHFADQEGHALPEEA